MKKKFQIGLIGSAGGDDYPQKNGATKIMMLEAEEVGKLLAKNNAIVITGGKSGIMEAGARGAKVSGGVTVGIVKGKKRFTSNNYVDVEVISGMEADGFDEFLLVNMCDGLIIVGGGAGTLEEMSIAYRNKKPLVALISQEGWGKELAGKFLDSRKTIKIEQANDPEEAVEKILRLIKK